MPDPYLDDILRKQREDMLPNYEQTQREQREFQARLKRVEEAERAKLRVDRDADDVTGPSSLTGDEARETQARRQAQHMLVRSRFGTAEREAAESLTDTQRQVAHRLGLTQQEAVKCANEDPKMPGQIVSGFQFMCQVMDKLNRKASA
jgi:hypothetical protein